MFDLYIQICRVGLEEDVDLGELFFDRVSQLFSEVGVLLLDLPGVGGVGLTVRAEEVKSEKTYLYSIDINT